MKNLFGEEELAMFANKKNTIFTETPECKQVDCPVKLSPIESMRVKEAFSGMAWIPIDFDDGWLIFKGKITDTRIKLPLSNFNILHLDEIKTCFSYCLERNYFRFKLGSLEIYIAWEFE
jgi:hypothetical protein